LQNDCYAHKIKENISFNKDDYEILLYFDFYILLVDSIFLREYLSYNEFHFKGETSYSWLLFFFWLRLAGSYEKTHLLSYIINIKIKTNSLNLVTIIIGHAYKISE